MADKFVCMFCGKEFDSPDEVLMHSEACEAQDEEKQIKDELIVHDLGSIDSLPEDAEPIDRVFTTVGLAMLLLHSECQWCSVFINEDKQIEFTLTGRNVKDMIRQYYKHSDRIHGFNVYIVGMNGKPPQEMFDALTDITLSYMKDEDDGDNDDDLFITRKDI